MNKLQGIYLVLDPAKGEKALLSSLRQALEGGVGLVQIWNHWPEAFSQKDKTELSKKIQAVAAEFAVPVLINQDWELALEAELDGVHFDHIPEKWGLIQAKLEAKLIGITVGNDLDLVRWAEENRLSYISFCSVFPSSSVDTCELVQPESIQKAREITTLPIFLSGGIRPENISQLGGYSFEGVAVISGILGAEDPKQAAQAYLHQLKTKA
ncbi:thiamine phosphate synthase [Algoriphagus sp. H41]|uniref:Thiamine phosphate synthase n=1 Tax=Algoriphagus oliviformis TaxID=2811231 RepID=A0ABS3C6I2_9BACT|nr:thiamine phosphate synthase [Algoriphagus oliviformis]MBN7811209.1 thiamine phosphate synthase [Algoriphagus oliviformis]